MDRRPGSAAGPPALLCDRMLIRLGRWLRAAGYDARIAAPDASDRALIACAEREGRWLVTRDRRLAAMPKVVVLAAGGTAASARELSARLDIDWLKAPFTRCLLCNEPLLPAPVERLQDVPARSRAQAAPLLHCPRCDRVYWPGGHVRRMRRRLERWRQGDFD